LKKSKEKLEKRKNLTEDVRKVTKLLANALDLNDVGYFEGFLALLGLAGQCAHNVDMSVDEFIESAKKMFLSVKRENENTK